jgi:16S rRNA (uracil1498-N3)-methyltransferase
MKLQRFFLPFTARDSRIESSDKELIRQLMSVFRFRVGSEMVLASGTGHDARVRITELKKNHVVFEVEELMKNANEPKKHATLYVAILKRENFEWVAQKATEIGVSAIVPLHTLRTVKLSLNIDRLGKIIKEAAEQSGRGRVPELHAPKLFMGALAESRVHELNILFDASGEKYSISDVKSCGIFIGPEGGWEKEEVSAARDAGCAIASLGSLTLRAETAAVVASYVALQS